MTTPDSTDQTGTSSTDDTADDNTFGQTPKIDDEPAPYPDFTTADTTQ